MTGFKLAAGLIALISACLLPALSIAQPAQGWRGVDRDGIFHETGLLKSWPEGGPQLVWKIEDAGKGYSSPVVYNENIFITGMDESETHEILSSYTPDGVRIYQTPYGSPWTQSYPDTRTTPTIVDGKVYVISGKGEVVCLNAEDGEIIWSVDGKDTFGVETNVWGVSESPLVFDGKVIFNPGGKQTSMVALDALTGETIWQTESFQERCSHVSPLLINHKGRKQIIGFSENYMYGVEPESGIIRWKFNDWGFTPKDGMDGICVNTPLYHDGRLFVSNAYEMRSHMLELNDDATGVKLLWRNDDLSAHTGGMVLVDGTIYASNFFNNNDGDWVALDWNTGKTLYKTVWPRHSKGAIVAADGMLYCYEERRGEVALVNPNPDKFDIVSNFRITDGNGAYFAHPTIHKGILYIRHGNAVMAYNISAGQD